MYVPFKAYDTAFTFYYIFQELSINLSSFDKRTLEIMLTRMEKNPPPSHLADLGTIYVAETHGRERRRRYFTVANYQALVTREGHETTVNVDLSRTGGFSELHEKQFFNTLEELAHYTDNFCLDADGASKSVFKANQKNKKNPVLPDGTRKRGRPRKDNAITKEVRKSNDAFGSSPGSTSRISNKRKHEIEEGETVTNEEKAEANEEPPETPKKRGRPRKKPRLESTSIPVDIDNLNTTLEAANINDGTLPGNEDIDNGNMYLVVSPKGRRLRKRSRLDSTEDGERNSPTQDINRSGDLGKKELAIVSAGIRDHENDGMVTLPKKRSRRRKTQQVGEHLSKASLERVIDTNDVGDGPGICSPLHVSKDRSSQLLLEREKEGSSSHTQGKGADDLSNAETTISQELPEIPSGSTGVTPVVSDAIGIDTLYVTGIGCLTFTYAPIYLAVKP